MRNEDADKTRFLCASANHQPLGTPIQLLKLHHVDNDGWHLDEVHEDVAEALHVVPPALLDPQVRVDRRVPSRTRQVLVFSEYVCLIINLFSGVCK